MNARKRKRMKLRRGPREHWFAQMPCIKAMHNFNAKYPVGTPVVVTTETGRHFRTRTASPAYKLHLLAPVVIDLVGFDFQMLKNVQVIKATR